ncbi:hypothetical protein AGR9A_Cc120334 [Agrobacterium salinitolerans str. Hayward 0363]|nr:hypothetical protein AGR9A_Cc120334 [Agrobacterium salinitolerans str. Hayward 0363]
MERDLASRLDDEGYRDGPNPQIAAGLGGGGGASIASTRPDFPTCIFTGNDNFHFYISNLCDSAI